MALLLPGMTLNASIFPDLGVPTIAPDFNRLRLGAGGAGRELIRHRMGLYVQLLEEFLTESDAWRASQRIVVGHSFGGMLALMWLASKAERRRQVSGLVLIATTAGPMYDRLSLRFAQFGSAEVRIPGGPLLPFWNSELVTQTVKWLVCGGSLHTERIDFRKQRIRSDLDLDLAGWRNTDWRAMRSYRLALEGFDVRDRLGEIRTPTLVLHGTRDSLFCVSAARELAEGLPDCELRIVEGAGHALPLTHGAEVERAVRDLWR